MNTYKETPQTGTSICKLPLNDIDDCFHSDYHINVNVLMKALNNKSPVIQLASWLHTPVIMSLSLPLTNMLLHTDKNSDSYMRVI